MILVDQSGKRISRGSHILIRCGHDPIHLVRVKSFMEQGSYVRIFGKLLAGNNQGENGWLVFPHELEKIGKNKVRSWATLIKLQS